MDFCDSVTVTAVESGAKGKSIIHLNGEAFCSLYNSEIRRLHISEGDVLSREMIHNDIENEILIPRGYHYILYLLGGKDYTEKQMKDKLQEHLYPPAVREEIVQKLREEGLANDLKYAVNYLEQNGERDSLRNLKGKLIQKGIRRELIEQAWNQCAENRSCEISKDAPDEEDCKNIQRRMQNIALEKCFEKKSRNMNLQNPSDRLKLMNYLRGKGFSFSEVNKLLEQKVNLEQDSML